MDEFEIIRRCFTPGRYGDGVIVGVGDDGAVLRPSAGRDLVIVTDTMVAGVHYPQSVGAADVGYRAVAVNVSDLAAMGARPRWMTLALTMDRDRPDWIAAFAGGIAEAADAFGVDLVGGDLTSGTGPVISVQVIGDVEPGCATTRSGAQAGDNIYVSGTPGDAALGLRLFDSVDNQDAGTDTLRRRFARPEPRVALGRAIAPHASAAIDVSDGLYADLGKLLDASGVGGELELDELPMSAELRAAVTADAALPLILGGGDDYELCFTSAASDFFAAGEVTGVTVTRIGRVVADEGLRCLRGGKPFAYQDSGYRHFQ